MTRKFTRREFIRTVGLAGAGVTLAPHLLKHVVRNAYGAGFSYVYRVLNCPVPDWAHSSTHQGLEGLLHLMGRSENPLHFYRTAAPFDHDANPYGSPTGIIAPNDVVLIKVNCEWRERGMTNTDLLRGLIQMIVSHPDGFTGEVVVVENGQWDSYLFEASANNAEDHGQSVADVAGMFPGHNVSLYRHNGTGTLSWCDLRTTSVQEYDQGNMTDGYVNNHTSASYTSYPKFTTAYGTRISLRHGIWSGSAYDATRLKFLNVPVLKNHSYMGVTAALKHYMGVLSTAMTSNQHHPQLYQNGLMGRMMGAVRFPDLNIIDALFVQPNHPEGPASSYSSAVRLNQLLAGVDPVALDYYAGKQVLYALSGYDRHNPDSLYTETTNPYHDGTESRGYPYNAFRQYLLTSQTQLGNYGFTTRMSDSEIVSYVANATERPSSARPRLWKTYF